MRLEFVRKGWSSVTAMAVQRLCSVAMVRTAPHESVVAYGELARTVQAVATVPERLKKEALMTALLGRVLRDSPGELPICIALTTLQLTPGTKPVKLGFGDALIMSALSQALHPESL